jgi:hypothetical protein
MAGRLTIGGRIASNRFGWLSLADQRLQVNPKRLQTLHLPGCLPHDCPVNVIGDPRYFLTQALVLIKVRAIETVLSTLRP